MSVDTHGSDGTNEENSVCGVVSGVLRYNLIALNCNGSHGILGRYVVLQTKNDLPMAMEEVMIYKRNDRNYKL